MTSREEISKVLKSTKVIAVIGLSDDPSKPAHTVASFLQGKGYTIVPVHPKAGSALGQTAYQSLAAIPGNIDMVYMFRGSDAAPAVMDEAIAKGAKAFWMPEGVSNEEAAKKGRDAGLAVVMDRCAKKELSAGLA
jgi:uncharacterized protein